MNGPSIFSITILNEVEFKGKSYNFFGIVVEASLEFMSLIILAFLICKGAVELIVSFIHSYQLMKLMIFANSSSALCAFFSFCGLEFNSFNISVKKITISEWGKHLLTRVHRIGEIMKNVYVKLFVFVHAFRRPSVHGLKDGLGCFRF